MRRPLVVAAAFAALLIVLCQEGAGARIENARAAGNGQHAESLRTMVEDYARLQGRTMDLLDLGDSRKMRPHPTQHRLLGHEDQLYNILAAMSPLVFSRAGEITRGGGREELLQWVGASLRSCADQSVSLLLSSAGHSVKGGYLLQYEPRSSGIPAVNVYSEPSFEGDEESPGELLLVIRYFVFPLGFDAMNAELLAFEQLRLNNREPEEYRLREPLQHHRCLVSSDGGDRFFDSVIYRAVPGVSLTSMLAELSSEVHHVTEIERTSGRLLSKSTMEMLLADHVQHISDLHRQLVGALGKAARALAELHLTSSRQDTPINPESLPQGSNLAGALSAYLSAHSALTEKDRGTLLAEAQARLEIARPFFDKELACIVHGDATPDNIIYDSRTHTIGLLDLTTVPSSFAVSEEASKVLRASYPAIPVRKEAMRPTGHAAWDYFYMVISATLLASNEPGLAEFLPVEAIVQSHYCAYRLLPEDCIDRNLLWADEVANYYQYVVFAAISPQLLLRSEPS